MTAFGLAVALSYLAGAFPTALIVGRFVGGVDIRTLGSGNAGATNVYRLFGLKPYLFTLTVDLFKGFAAVAFIAPIGSGLLADQRTALLCGVAAIVGHIWTLFAGFRGGKGVATAGGVFLGLAPVATGCAILVYLVITLTTKYVSLGSMTAALTAPAVLAYQRSGGADVPPELLAATAAVGILIVFTHRANIGRLLRGEESKTDFLSRKKNGPPVAPTAPSSTPEG
jgi:glycerol-3-phosphate acyltransferase PlsY